MTAPSAATRRTITMYRAHNGMGAAAMTPTPAHMQQLFDLRDKLTAASHGERRGIVEDFAGMLGKNANTVYAWLKTHAGYTSGRKKRGDAGRTRAPEETLTFIAGARREGVRGNDKQTLPMGAAMNMAATNGLTVNVSSAHMHKLLRQKRMDTASVMDARNHITLRSLHPNHLHQIDPSLCLIYYMGKTQQIMRDEEFYKNKPDNYNKIKLKVWRYVRYDHASGTVDVRYYEAAGENQASLFEFLLWTWGKQPCRLSHGVPKILLWDKGSANTSHAIQKLLDALGVDHRTHAAGHSWSKGGVEQANNLVETQFESRLRFEPVNTVEELNAAAARWVRDWNANTIQHVNAQLVRANGVPRVRDDLWQLILRYPGALVEMPERKVCQWFMRGQEQTRVVRDLKISFAHPQMDKPASYDLTAWAEFLGRNDKVRVSPLLLRDGTVRIEIDRLGQEPLTVEVEPERDFDAFGRPLSAQVVGEYSRAKETAGELAAKQLAQAAYGLGVSVDDADGLRAKQTKPFAHMNDGKGVIAHSHLGKTELPQRLLPNAHELNTPDITAARRARVELVPITSVEAAKRLRGELGDRWTAGHYQWLASRYPAGMSEEDYAVLRARWLANAEVTHGAQA